MNLCELKFDKTAEYEGILSRLESIIDKRICLTGNLANITALIKQHLTAINWVGFYLVRNNCLEINAFQGLPACTTIKKGQGVCGTSWTENKTMIVSDVRAIDNHIACDCNSLSEIVVPIHEDNEFYGVLDIDSPVIGRFDATDASYLQKIVAIIESII